MCGIYGAIVLEPGKKWNRGIICALTLANRERGTDSLGFFDSSGRMIKRADDPAKSLQRKNFRKWLNHSEQTTWFIAGHTRFATRGKVNRRNSHPFRYGRIIGSHNGIVDCPNHFKVDSEYLIWSLNKHKGDYQKGLEKISGYFGLAWFDGKDFYLLSHSSELAYVVIDGVLYYSSDWAHLDSCTGGDSRTFKEGQVMRFSPDGDWADSDIEGMGVKPFVHKAADYWSSIGYSGRYSTSNYGTSGSYRSGAASYHYNEETASWMADAHDYETQDKVSQYDSDWHDAWTEYCEQNNYTESIHALSDEEFNEKYAG